MASTGNRSLSGLLLIGLGAATTAIGGLGVGFRAAGLGYLGQSLLALTIGVVMLTVGLRVAANDRRATFATLRHTPIRVAAAYTPAPSHTVATQTVVAPARVRVAAWVTPHHELAPAHAA